MDYDQEAADAEEFIEIRNNDSVTATLTGYQVVLINGMPGTPYLTITLPAGVTVGPGGYYVLCRSIIATPPCTFSALAADNSIQNGAPDAVAIRYGALLIDSVSYEGNTAAPYTEGDGVSISKADLNSTEDVALARFPDGADTQHNNVDFRICPLTPGAANICPNTAPTTQTVISEFDYDQPGADTAEFIELRNNDAISINLSGFEVVLVNGAGGGAAPHVTYTLPNYLLGPGAHFVLCRNPLNVPNCNFIAFASDGVIQNDTDAVALRYGSMLIDTVSYEGNTGSPYTEGTGVSTVKADSNVTATIGLSRSPTGSDTNNNDADFQLCTITPGATNACP